MADLAVSSEVRPRLGTERSEARIGVEPYLPVLMQSPLFAGIDAVLVRQIARTMQFRVRSQGSAILTAEQPGEQVFVLVEGKAKVLLLGEGGREVTLAQLAPGGVFGEMSLLAQRPCSAHVVASEHTVLFAFSREQFMQHLAQYPAVAMSLLRVMSERLCRANENIASLALEDVEGRLVSILRRLASTDGEPTSRGIYLRQRPTQQEIANMVGSCRETVSRMFSSLKQRGLLEQRGRGLVLMPKLLQAPSA